MSEVVLVRGEDGKLQGLGDKGQRSFARFRSKVERLAIGETVKFSYWLPRSPGFHRRHFAILAALFKQQDQFTDPEKLRMWLQVGAGFCDLVPGPLGKLVAMPRSIAWENLDDDEFAEHHAAVIAFMRSTYCTRYLWPMWSDLDADTFINNVLMEFNA